METAGKLLRVRRNGCWRASFMLGLGMIASAAQAGPTPAPSQQKESATASVETGRKLFESMCAGCHGLDGRGGERGPDIARRPQVVQLTDKEALDILRKGIPAAGMPPFDSLGSGKLTPLLGHLRKLQGREKAEPLPGDAEHGKALFFGKARCAECHTMLGQGGFLGRDLSEYGAALSADEIRAKLVGPLDDLNRANRVAVMTLRDGSQVIGVIRNEDNFSVQLQSLDGTFHFLARADVREVAFKKEPLMPPDYGTTLSPAELNDLVSYLMQAARTTAETNERRVVDEDE